MAKKKIVRISTVPLSLCAFCKDLLLEIKDDYDVLAVSSPGTELEKLSDLGIPTEAVAMERQISIVRDIKSLFALVRLFRKHKPDMVHSITPKAGLLAMTAAWIARVPIRVHSFTGLLFPTASGIKRLILTTTDRATCRFATHILPEGEGVKNDLTAARITSKPMQVLGYGNVRGIDLTYYDRTADIVRRASELREKFGITHPESFVYVFVGRMVGDKGLNELAAAFAEIAKKYPHAHLIIAGNEEPDDPMSPAVSQTLHQHPQIHLSEGWIEDVRPYYAAADALVFPSYREGFPNVVLEGGALGLPSIVTDINGSREIIRDGYNGLIIPPRHTQALQQAMQKLIDNPDLTSALASTARKHIADHYEASFVRNCLRIFYDKTLNQ